jgi:hypothetical protein
MNTIENIHAAIQEHLQGALPIVSAPKSDDDDSGRENSREHARTGKVARLPAAVRESINQMLHDNTPYSAISEKVAELGFPGISAMNLSRWKEGGYVDWLCQRQQADEIHARSEWIRQLLTMAASKDALPDLPGAMHGALDLLVTNQLLAALTRVTASDLDRPERKDSFSRLVATVNGLFRERTRFQKLQLALRQYEDLLARNRRDTATPLANQSPTEKMKARIAS